MKFFVTSTLLLLLYFTGSSQSITYNWNSFTSGGTSYSNTQNGGCTMNASVSGNEYNGTGMPRFTGTGTLPGANDGRNGLFIDQNWSTQTNTTSVTLNFSPAITNPCFTIYDINRNNPCGAFCSSAWNDRVIVSTTSGVVNATTGSTAEHNITGNGTSAVTVDGKLVCNGTNANVQFCLTGSITNITIKYTSGPVDRTSGSGSCGGDPSGCISNRTSCPDPMRQYITIGNITGTSCCAVTNPPTSISGNTGPFCGPTTTTLTAAGAASNSQWHTGSCTGPIIGTGTSIAVTPASTTTYYVNNLDCSNNPTSCVAITVTVNPIPATPTISNTGLSICTGNTTTLTSSSATGNTWSTGSTAQSIVVSAAGTYTLRVSSGGCLSNPASVTVNTVSPPPTPSITAGGPTTFCAGGSVVLSSSNATGNTWNTGATTQTILVTSTGSYSVVSGSGSCTSSSSIFTVSVLPNPATPTITSTGNSICAGQSATLTSSSASGNTWSTGSTAQTTSVNATGTYSLFVTAANGCKSPTTTVNVTVSPVQPTPTVSANGPTTFCAGGNVVLSSSNASGNTWNTGATTQTILVTASGNYSVVSGAGTCSVSSTNFSVSVLPIPTTPSITSTGNSICSGETTTLTSSSASNNNWSTGETTTSIIVNSSGTYSLFVSSPNGCNSPTTSVNVSVSPVQLTPTITAGGPTTFCAGGSVVLSSSNVTGNVWNTGAITQTILVTSTGTYSIAAGSGSCAANSSLFNVTVNPLPPTPSITASANNLCSGQSAILTSSSLINNVWNTGATTNTIQVGTSGIYSLSVVDGNNCSSPTATISVSINTSTLNVLVPQNVLTCNGVITPSFDFTSTATNATYVWNNTEPSIGLPSNGVGSVPSFTATNNGSGVIEAIITVTPTADGCSGLPESFTISVNPAFVINAGINDTICFGSSTTLNASPNISSYTYSWQPAVGLSNTSIINPIANPNVTTNYTLTVTDANGCSGKDEVTIFANTEILSTLSSTNTLCFNSCDGRASVVVSGGNAPYQYTWSNNSSSSLSSSLCAGIYSVTIRDSWQCSKTSTVQIQEPTEVNASILSFSNAVCFASCDGMASGTATGGTGTYSYSWSTSPTQNNVTATNLCAGTYQLKVTDGNNCKDSVNVFISEPTPINLMVNPNTEICTGSTITLTTSITGGTPAFSYTWTPGNNVSMAMISVTPSVNTTYTVIASDSRGCLSNMANVVISIKAPLAISANNATICLGSNATLSPTLNGGNTNYNINWTPNTGLNNNGSSTVTASPTVTTIYTVTVTDGCSTPASTQVTVNVLPLPVISIASTASAGCAPLCVTLSNNSTVSNGTIVSTQWNIDGLGSAYTSTANYCFDTPGNYSVSVTATSSQGCSSTVVFPNYINVYPNPVADFEVPENISILNPLVPFKDLSTDAISWNWDFGDQYANSENQTSTLQNPSHSYENQGTYCVNLIVSNAFGCSNDTTKCLDILPEFTIYVPNAFTPDGDNLNDFFTAFGINIIEFELYIFDRWGEEIFHTNDIHKGWNGKVKNGSQIAKQDVYVWKITAKDIFEEYHYLTGHVTLIKKED